MFGMQPLKLSDRMMNKDVFMISILPDGIAVQLCFERDLTLSL